MVNKHLNCKKKRKREKLHKTHKNRKNIDHEEHILFYCYILSEIENDLIHAITQEKKELSIYKENRKGEKIQERKSFESSEFHYCLPPETTSISITDDGSMLSVS